MSIPRVVIEAVDIRADGRCELGDDCIDAVSTWFVYHHRQLKGMGGSKSRNTVGNLIRVHNTCHLRVHSQPEWSLQLGYIVSKFAVTP